MVTNRSMLKLVEEKKSSKAECQRIVGELWTSRQRQMHSLHYAVSYRASFKPELPDFCIRRYTKPGDIVFDPFTGRGTTALQANLLGRVAWASDANPLAVRMTRAKTTPAALDEVVLRLNEVEFWKPVDLKGFNENFSPFYHPDTYRELLNLRSYVKQNPDRVSRFMELLAISRLHGHSSGFFSVYSFPQISIPPESQRLINQKRRQAPEYRAVAPRIIKKAAQALRDGITSDLLSVASDNRIEEADARSLDWVPSSSVDCIVTSPPFLDKVDYLTDNWLECWFAGINMKRFSSRLVMTSDLKSWGQFMHDILREMARVLKTGGYAVVEVGEVEISDKIVFLDEIVAQEARKVSIPGKRLVVEEILVNQQEFTKLANCFKVENNKKGTNTNRLVVIRCASSRAKNVSH